MLCPNHYPRPAQFALYVLAIESCPDPLQMSQTPNDEEEFFDFYYRFCCHNAARDLVKRWTDNPIPMAKKAGKQDPFYCMEESEWAKVRVRVAERGNHYDMPRDLKTKWNTQLKNLDKLIPFNVKFDSEGRPPPPPPTGQPPKQEVVTGQIVRRKRPVSMTPLGFPGEFTPQRPILPQPDMTSTSSSSSSEPEPSVSFDSEQGRKNRLRLAQSQGAQVVGGRRRRPKLRRGRY